MLERGRRWAACGALAAIGGVAMVMLAASAVYGQEKPAGAVRLPPDSAQPAKRDYRFEVASIRTTDPPGLNKGGSLQPYSPGHYSQQRIYLAALVAMAFGVKHFYPNQIESPQWMNSAWISVNATLPEGATKEDLPIMIRHLLEDRFALKYHHEKRQVAGYDLVVAKSGAKFTKSAGPTPDPSAPKGPQYEFDKNGMMRFTKDGSGQLYTVSLAMWQARNKTMDGLASDLSDRLRMPVRDATGLEGEYDYSLTYTPGEEMYAPGYVPPAGAEASTPTEHPLLRDALREQLGLELRPVKNVPVDVLVVDSANKVPTEN